MKTRMFAMFVFGVGLVLLLVWSVTAQKPEPPGPAQLPERLEPSSPGAPAWGWEREAPVSGPLPSRDRGPQSTHAAAVALGQPGLNFRYAQTFGTTEAAYSDDTAHINFPYGVSTDGTNVWIADLNGLRALKYTNTGTFVMQIGKAGFRYGAGANVTIDSVADVAIDNSGNIWMVDNNVCQALKFNSSGVYVSKLGQTWSCGTDNSHFNKPISIAFDGAGNIYVSDGGQWWNSDDGNHRIQIFDSAGNYLNTIGTTGTSGSGNNQFHGPRHIAIYNNLLYVADSGNHRVQIFDVSNPASPTYVATIGITGESGSDNTHLNGPSGVTVDANYIYVADSFNYRIQIFDRSTRTYVATIGTGLGSGNTQFWTPHDVAVDSAGNVYVADFENARVQQFDSNRAYVRTYGTTGVPYLTDGYHYNQPGGVAIVTDGSMHVVEVRGHRLLKLNSAGVPQWTVGEAGVGSGSVGLDNAHFAGPNDVDLDRSGRVYVADAWNNRVQIFNSNGAYFATLGTGYGTGNYQFNEAYGIAVDTAGNIYVADRSNHRVQIYNDSRTYVATLGQTGVSGTDNAHFNGPCDVAVDSVGNIYVADQNNHRVQIFDSSRAYVRTIGVTGVAGSDFGHFSYPTAVAVDTNGHTYVADQWGGRVQVFDNSGAYLTTVGGSGGNRTGQMHQVEGLAIDSAGNLYAADLLNHRIQKFAPGVPGWVQVNINGFGDRNNYWIGTLAGFGDHIYAGTYNWSGSGAQLWRKGDTGSWTSVMTNGFGTANNAGIHHLAEFNGSLYAGTDNGAAGAEVWQSANGLDWTQVVSQGFGSPSTNANITYFGTYSNALYTAAGTWDSSSSQGAQVWRTPDGLSWSNVITSGFGDANNTQVLAFEALNGYFYAGTLNATSGGELWRSGTGDAGSWAQVNIDGFNGISNTGVTSLAAFDAYLYAGTRNWGTGAEVWRSSNGLTWTRVISNGFGGGWANGWVDGLIVFDNTLYAVTRNYETGVKVWRTTDGINWVQVNTDGFGDSNNEITGDGYTAIAIFDNRLYIGTRNYANGGEVWKKTVTADFSASPTSGPPPLTVVFTNTSAGDYTAAWWDFGDGQGFTGTLLLPAHVYTATGSYTVTLIVGDGVDSSTLTRPNYIRVANYIYLPLALRNH